MQLFDSHCHLDDRAYDTDIDAVIERAAQAEVRAMMIAGIDLASAHRAVALAEKFGGVYAAVGVHPHDASACSQAVLEKLRRLSAHPKVRAWGEIGLDFNRMYSPREDQERWFVAQLQLADSLGLPIIFHERDTHGRLIELLAQHPHPRRRAVIHCFSGSAGEMDRYLEMGFYIGITGIVTMAQRGKQLRALIPAIPSERLLIETDAPYLTPAPEKNKTRRNEPAFVKRVALKIAQVIDTDPAQVARRTWQNANLLFGIEHLENDSADGN